jgi:signal peptidase I
MEPLEHSSEPLEHPVEADSASAPPAVEKPEEAAPGRKERHGETAWEMLRSLLLVLVGVFCIRIFIAEATVIPTGSMENTILVGDHVFLNKLLYGPHVPYTSWRVPPFREVHHGDIIAFPFPRNPSQMFVKRAIALGGDVVKIVNKKVYLNGKLLDEPYARYQHGYYGNALLMNFPPPLSAVETLPAVWGVDPNWAREMSAYIKPDGLHVPPGYIFAMGDNRDNSLDSRFWGFVPESSVVGEPLFVYWSYDAPSRDWQADSLWARLQFDGSILRNFFHRTRWSRIGKIF